MKRFLLSLFFLSCMTYIFAIPNITLYGEDNEFEYKINNNKIYDEDNELIGEIKGQRFELFYSDDNDNNVITEDKDNITLQTSLKIIDNKHVNVSIYSKKTGKILKSSVDDFYVPYHEEIIYYEDSGKIKRLSHYSDGKFLYTCEYIYDKNENAIKEIDYDENDKIRHTTEYIYDTKKNQKLKEIVYDMNNKLDYYTIYTYDKKTNVLIDESLYDDENRILEKWEYDSITQHILNYSEYDDETGKLIEKRIYDEKSGYEIERQIYNEESKKIENYTFIQFDDNGKYYLEDGYYLSNKIIDYYDLENADKEKITNWNDFYNAEYNKITYSKYNSGYKYLAQLLKNNYLFNSSFTFCKEGSDTYYCFDCTNENTIDLTRCYQITLIKKEVNYKSMNKSGEGKGPFGIDIGMTYEDITRVCNGNEPDLYSGESYYIYPVNSHPLFKTYLAWISKKYGVYYIRAYSENITCSEYGTEVKNKYNNILTALEKKYGSFNKIDTIDSSYNYKDDKYWMKGLKEGARTYKARWYATRDTIDKFDGIVGIYIGIDIANKYSTSEAYIWIEYEFRNSNAAEDAINDVL